MFIQCINLFSSPSDLRILEKRSEDDIHYFIFKPWRHETDSNIHNLLNVLLEVDLVGGINKYQIIGS